MNTQDTIVSIVNTAKSLAAKEERTAWLNQLILELENQPGEEARAVLARLAAWATVRAEEENN